MAPYNVTISSDDLDGYHLSFTPTDGSAQKIPLNDIMFDQAEDVLAMLQRLKASAESIVTVQLAVTAGRSFNISDIDVDIRQHR